MQRWKVHGLSVAVIAAGRPVLCKGRGVRDIKSSKQVTDKESLKELLGSQYETLKTAKAEVRGK